MCYRQPCAPACCRQGSNLLQHGAPQAPGVTTLLPQPSFERATASNSFQSMGVSCLLTPQTRLNEGHHLLLRAIAALPVQIVPSTHRQEHGSEPVGSLHQHPPRRPRQARMRTQSCTARSCGLPGRPGPPAAAARRGTRSRPQQSAALLAILTLEMRGSIGWCC